MKLRGPLLFLSLAAMTMFVAAPLAIAQDKPVDESGEGELTINCDLTGYHNGTQIFDPSIQIPDNNPAGVTVGPIIIPGNDLILDVILDLRITHSFVGDLIATLIYDQDCVLATPNVEVRVLCRPRGAAASGPPPCGTGLFGCSGDLSCNNLYLFTDGTGTELGVDGTCTTGIPGGCYRPTIQGGGSFATFDGLRKGGCWFLRVSDHATVDTGHICQWSVHLLNEGPVPTQPATWGRIKTLYQ